MIKCNLGHVEIRGSLPELLQDTVHILGSVYESIIEKHGEEIANEHIVKIGKISVITDREERDKLLEEYIVGEQEKMFEDLPEELRGLAKGMLGFVSDVLNRAGDE